MKIPVSFDSQTGFLEIEELGTRIGTQASAQGPAGPAGPAGQDAVAISDAVRGEQDRYYREVGGVLTYNGTGFVAKSDTFSRPQNIDLVTTDSTKITVSHEDIGPRGLVESRASVGENLETVGIKAISRTAPNLKSTDILLRQSRSLNDALTNPGDGSAWTKERGATSPFTVSGLTNASDNFATYVQGLANVAAHWRLSEASGAVLDDAIGVNDGTVVGTPTAYSVTGGLPSDGTDKAITTTGVSTNEMTFPLAGVTQAAYSLVFRIKVPFATKTPFRDATSVTGSGTFVSSDLAAPTEHIQYRTSGSTFVTTTSWSALADDNWHTLVLTKSGANVALYLDGVLLHSAGTAGSTGITTPWHVGRNGTTTTYQVVTLSELVAYTRAITATEVKNIHDAALADGLLHVSHAGVGSTRASEIKLTPQGSLRPVLVPGSVTATGFSVKFLNSSGTQVTITDSNMVFGISRDVQNIEVNPTTLSVPLFVTKQAAWDVAVKASGPVWFARLGEPSGTSFNDEIGTNDGTSTATVTLAAAGAISGDADTAVTLDGAQGKIAFANPVLTGSWSFSVWFKCTGAGSVGPSTFSTLIGWGYPQPKFLLVNNSTGAINAQTGGASLTSPSGVAPNNQYNHLVYTWDGTTQSIIVNGLLVASSVTANVALNAAFFLGSYASPTTQYAFKGSLDEPALWGRALTLAEAQQLYVNGANTVLSVDRATETQITFRGLFETFAPAPNPEPEQPAPTATPLPAGDSGGAATSYASLGPYRSLLNGFYDWVGRPLPATQVARDAIALNGLSGLPAATSTTWKNWFCLQFGIDPTTGASTGSGLSGAATPLYISTSRYNVFVVPDNQPLRNIEDKDITVTGWASQVNSAIDARGGLPVPADALPDTSGDKYTFVYQPGSSLMATMYAHGPLQGGSDGPDERAITTLELTSSPSNGGFFLEFDYMDNVNRALQTFFLQSPVPYNCTASQLQTLLQGAKTTAGAVLGSLRANSTPAIVTGGPLNVAPLTIGWTLGAPLLPVAMRMTNNFMNAGTVQFTYENAENWSRTRLSAVTAPDVPGGHVPVVSGSKACATATRIVQLPLIIDWAEYKTAYDIGIASGWDAAGTDLGHVIGMVIGNCGTGNVYPATSGDGTLSNTDGSKMKEGALCTFPVTADASKVAPEMMPIFNTVKRYGFIVYDKTGIGSEFVCRNWIWPGQTRPFPGPSTFKTSTPNPLTYMRQLPWHQMQIIDPAAVLSGW